MKLKLKKSFEKDIISTRAEYSKLMGSVGKLQDKMSNLSNKYRISRYMPANYIVSAYIQHACSLDSLIEQLSHFETNGVFESPKKTKKNK